MGGPIPAGCQAEKEEAASGSGWEEPSPESIRRRMEIDDGTAAWGDPGKHAGGSFNLLDPWRLDGPAHT